MKSLLAVSALLATFSPYSVFANESRCHLEFTTYLPNIFGNYVVKKKLWEENTDFNSENCYARVHYLLKRNSNVSTRWTHIELVYRGVSGESSSRASFTKH